MMMSMSEKNNKTVVNNGRQHVRIKVSVAAYEKIKELASKPTYKGRGVVGVIDHHFLGEFTTVGSGRSSHIQESENYEK